MFMGLKPLMAEVASFIGFRAYWVLNKRWRKYIKGASHVGKNRYPTSHLKAIMSQNCCLRLQFDILFQG